MRGSRPSLSMIIPNTKRHPNNTKTDQLPISEVITGLPRPYHNNFPFQRFPDINGSVDRESADHADELRLLR